MKKPHHHTAFNKGHNPATRRPCLMLFAGCVALVLFHCKSQPNETATAQSTDTTVVVSDEKVPTNHATDHSTTAANIAPTELDHITTEQLMVSGIAIGNPRESLIAKLGKPDSVVQSLNEISEETSYRHYYKNSYFEISKNHVHSFNIADNNFVLEHARIQVGDSEEALQKYFPRSYANRGTLEDHTVIVRVTINHSDDYLVFKIQDGKIRTYLIWEDWS